MRHPVVYDLRGWQTAILEHRRQLFERIVTAFPEKLRSKDAEIEAWRVRLSGPRTGAN